MSNRGLGKGIEAILPSEFNVNDLVSSGVKVEQINVKLLKPNAKQPRQHFDEQQLKELAKSIKEHGVLQPLLVTKSAQSYQIVAGERRWRAAKLAGIKSVPCLVRSLNQLDQLKVALTENIQREDLNVLEQAASIQRLKDDFGMSNNEIAKSLGKSVPAIVNIARLLNLPDYAQNSLVKGVISEGHARAIMALVDWPKAQAKLHKNIVQNKWNVRRAEQFVKEIRSNKGSLPKISKRSSKYIEDKWTKGLSKRLGGSKVQINPMAKGGFIKISYTNAKELDNIKNKLK